MTLSPGSYPALQAELIQGPNRFWAVSILGLVMKSLLLIPVFIWLWLLSIFVSFGLVWFNAFKVLFTGSYSRSVYDSAVGLMRLNAKVWFYLAGLTDKYPGFDFSIDDTYALDIEFPEHPSRAFAIPVLGGLVRWILLIPFEVYAQVIIYATYIGVVVSSIPVLFVARYPETTFELVRDATRLYMAELAYGAGLSDQYPSFAISTNHGTIKGVLIVIGVLLMVGNVVSSASGNR